MHCFLYTDPERTKCKDRKEIGNKKSGCMQKTDNNLIALSLLSSNGLETTFSLVQKYQIVNLLIQLIRLELIGLERTHIIFTLVCFIQMSIKRENRAPKFDEYGKQRLKTVSNVFLFWQNNLQLADLFWQQNCFNFMLIETCLL